MNKTLESQLFTWEYWDECGPGIFMFYNVSLIVDIGQFKLGTMLKTATINMKNSKLYLYDFDDKEYEFNLSLSVTE